MKRQKRNILTSVFFLIIICGCHYSSAQHFKNDEIDTVYIWKGSWGVFNDDKEMYLTIKHCDNVLFQEKTIDHKRIFVLFTADYTTDSLLVMHFEPSNLSFYITRIEDKNGGILYNHLDIDGEEYIDSFFDYSCFDKLYDYLNEFKREVQIFSNLSSPGRTKEGRYNFIVIISPNNIECF